METDYIYTLGLAGERFFTEIKENGRILGAKCKCCGYVFLPPRLYCERCFEKVTEWVNLGTKGTVYTFTVAYVDIKGAKLKEPTVYALIKFNGAEGGIVHKLGEIEPHEARIGIPVEAIFKPQPERTGHITDIKYFKPQK
jgi:uncharacterized OB-fold protein